MIVLIHDSLVSSNNEDSIGTILSVIRKKKLYAKFSICDFLLKSVAFLGHLVSK